MELLSTERFTVFGCGRRSTAEEGELVGANGGATTNTCRNGDDIPAAVASALAFEKGGVAIDIPTMQLRELNNTNTSRYEKAEDPANNAQFEYLAHSLLLCIAAVVRQCWQS